jgi:glycosyltransferase involved in cell wall biosynthesis
MLVLTYKLPYIPAASLPNGATVTDGMSTRQPRTGLGFSIITVSRNAAHHITKCLQSVADQTYEAVEHIVIDGASTDGTQALVARHGKRVTRFVSEPDEGIYDAMNKGLRLSSQDYILFLGADDYLMDGQVIEDVAAFLEREGRPDMIYGSIEVRQTGVPPIIHHPRAPAEALDLMICGCLPHQATFARRDVFFGGVGLFDTRYKVHADYDWFLRVLGTDGLRVRQIDRVVSSYFLGGASSQLETGELEVYDIQNSFPLYRRPAWVERRLKEFQKQLLAYRVQLQTATDNNRNSPSVMPSRKKDRKNIFAAPARALARILGSRKRGDASRNETGNIPPEPATAVSDLSIHFFTIVLNGEPFIRYHLDMLMKLPFRWHWHIVEGVAELVQDTAWSVATGGRVDASFHERARSKDGTSEYLDAIAAAHPDRITLYRKPLDKSWYGKLEMVSAPLNNIREECLLWEIDSDEIWRAEQIAAVRNRFLEKPEKTAAYFWCHCFVGPDSLISTRYNYAENPAQEWLRVWRYKPGDHWAAHEPPKLIRSARGFRDVDVARIEPIMHDETEAIGAVFQHFAYVTDEQVRFKEVYYGYPNAVKCWQELQTAIKTKGSVLLRNYLNWVTDDTMADAVSRLGVEPLAVLDKERGEWRFRDEKEPKAPVQVSSGRTPRIVIDGVFFQHDPKSGIARVWRSLLTEWLSTGFAQHVIVLDRAGKTPRIAGLRYRSIAAWDERKTGADSFLLQKVCDEVSADLFVSSYYTTPISTPSIFVAHDMIPELLGAVSDAQLWYEKHHAIDHAALHICVSNSTRNDLLSFFPKLDRERIFVVPHGVNASFRPATDAAIAGFRRRHHLTRPYFLIVGTRIGFKGYKNTPAFFRAFARWPRRNDFDIVCVGGAREFESDLRPLAPGAAVHHLELPDEELSIAYSAATALIYPSLYEGFGLPILEAMACGCPVVTALGSGMEEVSGEAALHFDPKNPNGLVEALSQVVEEMTRRHLVAAGLEHARRFNWPKTAAQYGQILLDACAGLKDGRIARPSPVWHAMREEQMRNQTEIARLRG